VLPEYFQDILDGKKKYELRLNDFEIEVGDILVLEEYTTPDPETRKATGRILEKEVTYLRKFKLQDLWWTEEELREKGIQIISFENGEAREEESDEEDLEDERGENSTTLSPENVGSYSGYFLSILSALLYSCYVDDHHLFDVLKNLVAFYLFFFSIIKIQNLQGFTKLFDLFGMLEKKFPEQKNLLPYAAILLAVFLLLV
jgi:ASC-1-like (ASCH) protein